MPAKLAKSASLRAVLNWVKFPDKVLFDKLTVLLVSVSVPAKLARSASLTAVLN